MSQYRLDGSDPDSTHAAFGLGGLVSSTAIRLNVQEKVGNFEVHSTRPIDISPPSSFDCVANPGGEVVGDHQGEEVGLVHVKDHPAEYIAGARFEKDVQVIPFTARQQDGSSMPFLGALDCDPRHIAQDLCDPVWDVPIKFDRGGYFHCQVLSFYFEYAW
jgi:hypothetical protein